MSRAQPKTSPADDDARKIATAIAEGRPPPCSDAFNLYCANSPGDIFAAFTGAVCRITDHHSDRSDGARTPQRDLQLTARPSLSRAIGPTSTFSR